MDCCDEGSSGVGGDGWIGSDGVAVEGVELLENIFGVDFRVRELLHPQHTGLVNYLVL